MSEELTEEEEIRFIKMINHKQLARTPMDQHQSVQNDTISNSLSINPFRTLTSYTTWCKRNLLLLSETDEIVYVSGSNLILENYETKRQKFIPLKIDCVVTSLYSQKSSTNENILFIGEKVNPNSYQNYFSGRVEIFNLDNNVLREKLCFDLGVHEHYDSYVFDVIANENSDLCFVILANLTQNEPKNKIYIYNYVTIQLLAIEEINFNILGFSRNAKDLNSFVLYSGDYVAIWGYDSMKKQVFSWKELYNKNNPVEITYAESIRFDDVFGLLVCFKNEFFEVFHEEENEDTHEKSFVLFLRADAFSFLPYDYVSVEECSVKAITAPPVYDNFVHPFQCGLKPNFSPENKTKLNIKNNYVKFIFSRGEFVFVFVNNCPFVFVLKYLKETNDNDETVIKLKCVRIEKLGQNVSSKSSIGIDGKMEKLLIVNGEELNREFNILSKQRENKNDSKINVNNYYDLKPMKLTYFRYVINWENDLPSFIFEEELLPNTANGFPCMNLLLSETPKLLMINNGNNQQEIFIYKIIQTGNEEQFDKIKNMDAGTNNYIQQRTKFYKDNTFFENIFHKKFEDFPLSLCFSPLGKCFFVAFKDCGYLYCLLGAEIKEIMKVTMYCGAAAFDSTGTYLAFSTSEFESEYVINVFNLNTYEYEYQITKIPSPEKLSFINDSKILVARFNDANVNLIGWKLKQHLIKANIIGVKERLEVEKDDNVVLRIADFSGNIMDYVFDPTLNECLITSTDRRVRVYKTNKQDVHWEFSSEYSYPCCLIIKKYDTILFGTSKGSIRACLWPIQNKYREVNINHPEFLETFVHEMKVTSLALSKDLNYLFSSSEDGSIFVSLVTGVSNDLPIIAKNYLYFNEKNIIPKKLYFEYNDVVYLTDQIYESKCEALKNKKSAIQNVISEFQSNKEKLINANSNELDKIRTELTENLEDKVKAVKEKENEKEKETKKLKTEREIQIKNIKDELNVMKREFKIKKEEKQIETTKLINCIKVAKEKFEKKKSEIEEMRNKTNANITNCLENMHQILIDKKNEIDKMIEKKKEKFNKECEKNEELYETEIRNKEFGFKNFLEDFEDKKKETENEIMKKNKDNKNYNEKINEWENHLKELKINNEELMETYIFNTLKLNQMNQLLTENENKISQKEKKVKEKRLVNDRLEQLRFVLEYQIKNLILEKTPIEEQIKNFESLHSDFYKRFNLLYAELLNIGELIENNRKCIDTYRDELSDTKKNLYRLKNLYKAIDVALNSILKNKLNSKKDIIDQIFNVYQTYLYNFNDGKKQTKIVSPEMKLQTKNIEKEIYHQKNNVLKELIEKRNERKKISIEKEEMMKDIRLDNQLLIQECSNIRENLEDILKNINDIEKKFIELTNNNNFLDNDMPGVVGIKNKIKEAKNTILLNEDDKTKIAKDSSKKEKLLPPLPDFKRNANALNPEELRKKQEENTKKMNKQKEEVENMQKKLRDIMQNNEKNNNFNNQRNLTIKTNKYYDSAEGNIKK